MFSLRYGVTERINVTATLPYHQIESNKFQGAWYLRENSGVGDLVVMGAYRIGTLPQWTFEAGVKFATGNVDKLDSLGQRVCDILALGSGTNDLLLGVGMWWPHAFVEHLDVTAGLQHRFSGGENKWGYQFGDQTVYSLHGSYPLGDQWRGGVRAEGFHADVDTWYGNVVPERGATMLYLGPTTSMKLTETTVIGAFARFPVAMNLEGSQMVAPVVFGIEMSSDLSRFIRPLVNPGVEE